MWVSDWMEHMGAAGAMVTKQSGDGGVDVIAPGYVAQVKHYATPVGIAEIRSLVGAAAVFSGAPKALFFCSGGFPSGADAFADQVGMALFSFDPTAGSVTAINHQAQRLSETGLFPPQE